MKIGLEIHVQMTSLRTKLFCGCSSDYRRSKPNENVCPVCLGLPGALPVVNEKAIEKAIQVALALHMKIADTVSWARKHYFYPDLPKNYQITQYDGKGVSSIATGGYLEYEVNGNKYTAKLRRINVEEDPGKIVYPTGNMLTSKYTLIDYNRSGIALLEIVTEPVFSTPQQVTAFLKKLRSILEHLDVADLSLEGSMRVDVNISVSGGTRVEVKNIGSIAEIEKAILYEVTRQKTLREMGKSVEMETRHWDPDRKVTVGLRTKETEEDYRYIPDPNLPSIKIEPNYIEKLKASLPELPDERANRFMKEYGLNQYIANILVSDKRLADFFEETIKFTKFEPQKVASFVVNDLLGWIGQEGLRDIENKISPQTLGQIMEMLRRNSITIKMAKEMLPLVLEGASPEDVLKIKGWDKVIEDEMIIAEIADEIIRAYPSAVNDALKNEKAIQFLVGKILEATNKKANPKKAYEILKKKIDEIKVSSKAGQ